MVCIYCGGKTQVTNSRLQKRANHIWRRRKCTACASVITTSEVPELAASIMVQNKTGLEPFSRDKFFLSIHESCKHRKTALSDAQALTETVISQVLPNLADGIVPAEILRRTASQVLGNFDRAAQTHYSAFHTD